MRTTWPSALMGILLLLAPVLTAIALGHSMGPGSLADILFTGAGFLVGGALCMTWTHKFSRLVRAGGNTPQSTAGT